MIQKSELDENQRQEDRIATLAIIFAVWIMVLITGVAAAVVWALMV